MTNMVGRRLANTKCKQRGGVRGVSLLSMYPVDPWKGRQRCGSQGDDDNDEHNIKKKSVKRRQEIRREVLREFCLYGLDNDG